MLGMDDNLVSDKIGRVETHTKLTNHGNVGASLQSFHKSLGTRLGDGAQVVDQVGFGHADTGVDQG